MKIVLIGHGAMGQLLEKLAPEKNHEIVFRMTSGDAARDAEELTAEISKGDVAIDFSVSSAVPRNIELCMLAAVPLVEGTTGWPIDRNALARLVEDADSALVYGANFSVGAQVFFRIAARAAELFQNLDSYDVFIEEAHHKRKRPKNRRCGCLMCKAWKVNGISTERLDAEKFSDHRRRRFAAEEIRLEAR